jgi:hypothetical protein
MAHDGMMEPRVRTRKRCVMMCGTPDETKTG